MKKILAFTLTMLMLLSIAPVYAASLDITEQKTLIEGVTYTHTKRLTGNGWQDIYVVQADLKVPHLQFRVLSSKEGKSYLQNTYSAAVEADAIAAINSDFFSAKRDESGRGSAIGIEITDGILRTSPAAYESMFALYQPKDDDSLYFNQFTYDFKLTAPSGESDNIVVINKYDDLRGIVMYTPDWGSQTPGSGSDVLEMVVEDGIVIDKFYDKGPTEIPKNGYVLATNITLNTFLDTQFNIGDPVTIDITTLPNFNNLETAVGGGGMILVEGEVPSTFSHTISGLQPRSAVGVDKSGTVLTLAAVDGRRNDAKGMTMSELGILMKEFGCYNAMNADGGGSTLLAIKDEGTHVVANQPSDNYKRPVTNSIGVVSDLTDSAILTSIQLSADDNNVFMGTSRKLTLKAYDQYQRYMRDIAPDTVNWSILKGRATIKNGVLYPESGDTITVQAQYNGQTDSLELKVLPAVHRLSVSKTNLQLSPGNSFSPVWTGYDEIGRSAAIYASDLETNSSQSAVATISNGTITAKTQGSCVVTAALGMVTANMVVTVGTAEPVSLPKNLSIPDIAQRKEIAAEGDFTFTVFGNTREPKVLFDVYLVNGAVNAVERDSNLNFFVGNDVNPKRLSRLGESLKTAQVYSSFKQGNNTFITLQSSYGESLFSLDKTQLQKLRDEVNSLTGGNLFVFLNDHNISSLDVEVQVFKNMMKEAAQKCDNVYVFAGGYVNETKIEDGVRYVTTAGIFPSIGLMPPTTNLSYIQYYVVTVKKDSVTYQTKGILKK